MPLPGSDPALGSFNLTFGVAVLEDIRSLRVLWSDGVSPAAQPTATTTKSGAWLCPPQGQEGEIPDLPLELCKMLNAELPG